MKKKFIFFSDGEELEIAINKILERQNEIIEKIEKLNLELENIDLKILDIKKFNKRLEEDYKSSMATQKEENANIYRIVHQLLLKDMLIKYKNLLEDLENNK